MMRGELRISTADRHGDRRLRIRYSYHHPAVVVQVAGEVDPTTMPYVRHSMKEALKGAVAPFPVVLDLSETPVVSDACLEGLVALHQQARGQQTPLRVVAAAGPVLRALTGAGMNRVLSIHTTLGARHATTRLDLPEVERLAHSWGSAPALPHGAVVWATLPA